MITRSRRAMVVQIAAECKGEVGSRFVARPVYRALVGCCSHLGMRDNAVILQTMWIILSCRPGSSRMI